MHTVHTAVTVVKNQESVADLEGKCPPFMMKTQFWHPHFGKESAPYPDPNALLLQCFVLNVGNR